MSNISKDTVFLSVIIMTNGFRRGLLELLDVDAVSLYSYLLDVLICTISSKITTPSCNFKIIIIFYWIDGKAFSPEKFIFFIPASTSILIPRLASSMGR